MTPLSVLDLSPVTSGTPGSAALRKQHRSRAALADGLGYTRYWVAEHHNLPSIASSAPDIMIGQIAAATSRMRVGSGGVMLPNHAPLMVAERFKVLEGPFFPAASTSGSARAPGTDQITSFALRRRQDGRDGDDFLERFQELVAFDTGGFPENHPFGRIRVMPDDVRLPPIWLLGSSDYGAVLAAQIGAGFAFAQHFASYDAARRASELPRAVPPRRRAHRPRTRCSPCMWVCADTDAEGPTASPPPSTLISCAARRANICRSRAPTRPPPMRMRRSTASASATTASACSSAARPPSRRAFRN